MSDVIINVDEPEVIITDEYSTDYNLPIASSNTLGGVKIGDNINIESDGTISIPTASADTAGVIKVGANLSIDENGVLSGQAGGSVTIDSALSTVSANPVQNRVITNALNAATGDIATLQGDITTINGDIGDVEESISTVSATVHNHGLSITALQSAVETNTNDISTNAGNIATNTGNIRALDGRLDTAEDNITSQGNAIGTIQGFVEALTVTFDEVASGTSIDSNVWTDGDVTIRRRGNIGFINISLEGSLTINSSSSALLYTQVDQDNLPAYKASGCIYTDNGVVFAEYNTDGTIYLYNNSNQNISLTYLEGSIPAIYV
jgi:hypothetical protein